MVTGVIQISSARLRLRLARVRGYEWRHGVLKDRSELREAPDEQAAHARQGSAEALRRRPTINDIARLAGVSKKTVSRVINASPFVRDDTRERIEAVIAELGYAPDPRRAAWPTAARS